MKGTMKRLFVIELDEGEHPDSLPGVKGWAAVYYPGYHFEVLEGEDYDAGGTDVERHELP